MYSALNYQLMQDRVADLHHQAQRDALARAARRARTHRPGHPAPAHLPAVRYLLTVLGARASA